VAVPACSCHSRRVPVESTPVGRNWRKARTILLRWHTVGTYTAVALDLGNELVLRGVPETGEQGQQPLMLLQGIGNVSVYLTTSCRTGVCNVAVFEVLGKAQVIASGTASVQPGLTVLKANLDISRVNSGHYLLGIPPPGAGWSYHPP
jgi:hypothetical protein